MGLRLEQNAKRYRKMFLDALNQRRQNEPDKRLRQEMPAEYDACRLNRKEDNPK